MTIPGLLLGILFSTFYGVLFHLLTGGGFNKLILDILLGWLGFWVGHFIAERFGWTFFSIGPLHWGLATVLSVLFLAIGFWLSLIPKKPEGTG
jgi:uncharacterized membrane protein YeaQ/YmgE (transglycosylase-associated protein family)